MKPNEAPETIYLCPSELAGIDYDEEWYDSPIGDSIEYTRTDALIEKAWDWIENNLLSSNQQDKSRLYYKQFVNYMKGG